MSHFTSRKFLALPSVQQHKKCSEILREAIESESQEIYINKLNHYQKMLQWLNMDFKPLNGFKEISDRYHYHLKIAEQHLKEHRLLSVKKTDKTAGEPFWNINIYLDNLRSAHNVGSIIRTTEAFRLGKIHFSPVTPSIANQQVKNAAMGCEEWVETEIRASLFDLPSPYIALETSEHAISLYDFIFPETFTLIVGNEEYGCSDETLAGADYLVEIPLRGKKNSLNVANAFAVAAAEIQRQKLRVMHEKK